MYPKLSIEGKLLIKKKIFFLSKSLECSHAMNIVYNSRIFLWKKKENHVTFHPVSHLEPLSVKKHCKKNKNKNKQSHV